MSKKTLLVLAASRYQIPTLTTAKRLGYQVITTDNVPSNPGHTLADKSYGIDTTDKQAVLEIAWREKIDGIIAPCTDVAVPTAAYVAEQLGLQGVPLESANIVCDKIAFRQFLQEHKFPTPEAYPITCDHKPEEKLFQRTWIIKPDRSSGSKGVFILRSLEDFYRYLPKTLSFSPTGRGILEEFIDGFQGTCEGVLKEGELALTVVLDRQTVSPPYVATCGHHIPSLLSAKLQEKLFAILKDIWYLLRVTDSPFDCDFVVANDEVYIIELTPRIGGNCIEALLKKTTGFNIVEYSIKQACREPMDLPEIITIKHAAAVLLGVKTEGNLYYNISELDALRKERWVGFLSIDFDQGQPVYPFINGKYRVGEAFIFGKNRGDVDTKVVELKQRLQLGTA